VVDRLKPSSLTMSAFLKLSTPLTSFYSPNTLGHATSHCSGSLILFGPSNVCTGELALLGLSLPANGNHRYISYQVSTSFLVDFIDPCICICLMTDYCLLSLVLGLFITTAKKLEKHQHVLPLAHLKLVHSFQTFHGVLRKKCYCIFSLFQKLASN
jgi:hypothetical protein